MHKKALLALMLALAVLLSGCALIEKDEAVDMATEVIRVGDTVYTKGEILSEMDYQLNYMAYYYSMFGMAYDVTDPELIAETRQSVINSMVESAVCSSKASELGLDQLDADEQAQLDAAAQESWEYNLESIQSTYFADTTLTGDALQEALVAKAEELGMPWEYVVEYEKSYIVSEKLYDYVVADVKVTDEELQAAYEENVATQKADFESYPSSYGNMVDGGSAVYYHPAGYRTVKQILVAFTDEDQAVLDTLDEAAYEQENVISSASASLTELGVTDVDALCAKVTVTLEPSATVTDLPAVTVTASFDADTSEEAAELATSLAEAKALLTYLNEQYEAFKAQAYANIAPEADEVLAQLAGGADWETLMAEKNDDPGMMPGSATAERGYAICAETEDMDPAFVDAAMALTNVGDVSDKVEGQFGYYIIRYNSDVEEGAVPLADVTESLTAELLAEKQETVYSETVTKWVEAADVKIDYNALEN